MPARCSIVMRRSALCILTFTACALAYPAPPRTSNQFELDHPDAPPAATDSLFGASVAATKEAYFVGAPLHDYSGVETGGVYRFNRRTGASEGALSFGILGLPNAQLGASMAASPMGLAISGPGFSAEGVAGAGVVLFIPTRDTGAYFRVSPTPTVNGAFGTALALYKKTLVIGAPGDPSPGSSIASAGAAYWLNVKSPGIPVPLVDPAATASDSAGEAVAVGSRYIVVGCPGRSVSGQSGAGAVTVYDARTGAFVRTIENPEPSFAANFGASVATVGKIIAVGAPNADLPPPASTADVGKVYQFDGRTGLEVRSYNSPVPLANAHFATRIATDGKALLISSPDENYGATDAGAVDIFDWKSGAHVQTHGSPNPAASGRFGLGATVLKGSLPLIGAPGEQTLTIPKGRAYTFIKER